MPDKPKYNSHLIHYARALRNDSTQGEIILWSKVLRAKKMHGFQFNRQFPIHNFIVDFICRKLKLIIEIDGYSHEFKYNEDSLRDKYFIENGYRVLRFSEQQVRHDIDNVAEAIEITVLRLSNLEED